MSFYNQPNIKKEATEIDIKNAVLFSEDIHNSIMIIVESALVQLVEYYDPEELTDEILMKESDSIAQQTCNVLSDMMKGKIKDDLLEKISQSISILITMKYINEIEPLVRKIDGREDQGNNREEEELS